METGLTLYPLALKNFKSDIRTGIHYQQVHQCIKILGNQNPLLRKTHVGP
jgi:hypothetical protein